MKGTLNRLVNTSKHILCLLLPNGTNVNQIIKQTSSDRTYVLKVIDILQEEGLISESRDKNHSQKKIKNLTELGLEIAEIIESIHSYNESYEKLKQYKEKYLNDSAGNKKIDLADQRMHAVGVAILEYETADYVKDYAIFRFLSIWRRLDVQKTTKDILEQIIFNATKRQMDAIVNNIGWINIQDPLELIDEFSEHSARIAKLPEKMGMYGLLSHKFAAKDEAKQVLLSVIPMFSQTESILDNIAIRQNIIKMKKKLIDEEKTT